MLKLIKVFVFCFLSSGAVWGANWGPKEVMENPTRLLQMNAQELDKLVEAFTDVEYNNTEAEKFLVESIIERFKRSSVITTYERINCYTELGAAMERFFYRNAKNLGKIPGTVFEKVFLELPGVIKNLPQENKFSYLTSQHWQSTTIEAEQIQKVYNHFLVSMSGYVDMDLYLKDVKSFFDNKRSEENKLFWDNQRIEAEKLLRIKEAIQLYTFGRVLLPNYRSGALADEFLNKALKDLKLGNKQEKQKALSMLTSDEAIKLIYRNTFGSETYTSIYQSINDLRDYMKDNSVPSRALIDIKIEEVKVLIEESLRR